MINWMYFPKSQEPPEIVHQIVKVFETAEPEIKRHFEEAVSNVVLSFVRPGLIKIGFDVESGKKKAEKIYVPVLFGLNGKVEKYFEADAWNRKEKIVLEVEAGRGIANNQFLKDLFQACMMHDVDYCAIALRNLYVNSRDFEKVVSFFETLYSGNRLQLPLKGVLLVGYL